MIDGRIGTGGVVSPVMVGRGDELAAVVAALSRSPAVIVVEGEAGIGKSRLVTEVLRHPDVSRRRHLVGRCHQIREPFPLGAIVEAVRRLGDDLRGFRLGPVAGALRPLLPEVADSLPLPPEPLDDRTAEQHRVFRGLVEVLEAAGPAVLLLEDLQYADPKTADFLAYLLAEPPPRLAVVLTLRREDADPTLRSVLSAVPVHGQVVLHGLTTAESGELAAAILDTDRLSDEFASYIRERTAGLPFAIEELLALVRANGKLVHHDGQWSRRALRELGVPRRIVDATMARIDRLPAGARRIAEAAAVLQSPQPDRVLIAVADEPDPVDALEAAVGSGLIVEREGSLGFRHLLAAQAVLDSLSGLRRQHLHDRAATTLLTLDHPPLGQVAHHLKQAGRLAEWTDAAQRAAEQAVELGDDDEAVRLLRAVLREAPLTPEQRGRVAARLAWAALDTLHASEIVEPLTEVLDDDPPAAVRGELRILLAMALGQAGQDIERQRGLFRAALGDLAHRPDLRAWAMVGLGVSTTEEVSPDEDRRWLTEAAGLVDQIDDPLLQAFVLGRTGSMMLDTGDPSWRGVTDRVLRLTDERPRQRREASAYYSLGLAATYAGQLEPARLLLTKALEAPVTQHNRRLEMIVRSGLAVLRFLRGEWEGLHLDIARLRPEVTDHYGRMDLELAAGSLALARGDRDEGRALLERATAAAAETATLEVLPLGTAGLVRSALADGEIDRAVGQVDRLLDILRAKGALLPSLGWALPDVVAALIAADRTDHATDLLDEVGVALGAMDGPILAPAAAEAGAMLADAAGSRGDPADVVLAAAAAYREAGAPYAAALATERAAALLLSTGYDRAPDVVLEAATMYDGLGATGDRARLAALAQRHGIELPRRHRGGRRAYGALLSPREREVATLAASGRTNNEIAEDLFISRHTVEKHLGAALRKLGVRSRTALAHHWAESSKNGGFP